MRSVIALLACVACGRVGFGAFAGDGGGGGDDAGGSGSGSDLSNTCSSPGYGDTFEEALPCNAFGMPVVTNGGLATSNGTLTITPNASANTMVGCARSNAAFGPAGAFVEVSQVLPAPGQTLLLVQIGVKTAAIVVTPPFLRFVDWNGNTVMTAYDPTAMRWWRLRPVDGGLYAETSPEGKTWTRIASSSPGVSGSGTVAIYVQTDTTNTAPGTAKVEGIDVCPPQ
ncbi:MAG: hypothetical protein ABJE66_36040 [Deltaproteobacteria bacterium]